MAEIIKDTFMLIPRPQSFVNIFVIHMATIKPTVPHTRMGGKYLVGSLPSFFKIEKPIELFSPSVGI